MTVVYKSELKVSLPLEKGILERLYTRITKETWNLIVFCEFRQNLRVFFGCRIFTVKILKFGTPQTVAIIVLEIEKFDVTLH